MPRTDATLHAPLYPRKNVFCVGRNYLAHAEEGARALGKALDLPSVPTFFTKAPTSIAGPDATLNLSGIVSQKYDWEAELAVVIGTKCKDVAEKDALDMIYAYTALNDVSARDLQRATTQWFKGKTLDDTCPLGPWLVTADEIGDPQQLDVSLRVNGETKQHASTSAMIFSVARCIADLSQGTTLEPGDIIATGTPSGVALGMKPPVYLEPGDKVSIEISGIGELANPVTA
jgi:2-keto-4-pentenoate hydratase/2-oxohepta-3-ene-1,7-dioic acid hydratase in catechol pathway